MTKSKHTQQPKKNQPDLFCNLFIAASSNIQSDTIRLLGRKMLFETPIEPDLKPGQEDDPNNLIQSSWVDDQLCRILPLNSELNSLGDAKYSVLESAWPEGFDEVVFDTGVNDDYYAEQLIELYLEWAERFTLPLMTDFDATEKEMTSYLMESFKKMIIDWRKNVMDHFRKKS